MKSWEDRWEEIKEDPVRIRRLFTFIWAVAYGMLMLGSFLIILIFATDLL